MAIKRIDIQSGKFEANGRTYYIQENLSLRRYTEYLKLSNEISFGVTFNEIYQTLNKIWKACSTGNDILAAINTCRELSYNQINAVVDFASREHPTILRFCALFINAEDEDLAKYDDRIVDQKINDWIEEGLDIQDFFYLAARYNPEFIVAFKELKGAPSEKRAERSQATDSTTTTGEDKSKST